jgi:MFS-type transporter involved in bile tolerance (Atg22 family)
MSLFTGMLLVSGISLVECQLILRTEAVGYHNAYDFWILSILFRLFQAPYYLYSQTMVSELIARGYKNMFLGLSGFINRLVGLQQTPFFISSSDRRIFVTVLAATLYVTCDGTSLLG